MTKITIIEAGKAEEKYAVGDWFLIGCSLYVLVQHRVNFCKMISISQKDANRKNEVELDWTKYGHNNIPAYELDNLFRTTDWQKVSVEIIVNK